MFFWTSLVSQMVKKLPAMQETQVPSLGWKDPWRRKWQPTPVLLPGKFQGQRSLVGYSPWDRRVRHECATNFHIHFQMVLTIHCSLNPLPLKTALTVGTVSKAYIPRTRERVRSLQLPGFHLAGWPEVTSSGDLLQQWHNFITGDVGPQWPL